MAKTHQRFELDRNASFLQDFAQHRVDQVLTWLQRSTGQLVVDLARAPVPLAHDQQLLPGVDYHAAYPDVMRGVGWYEGPLDQPTDHHQVAFIAVMKEKSSRGRHGDERGALERHAQPHQSFAIGPPGRERTIERRRKLARVSWELVPVDDDATELIGLSGQ